MRTPIPFNSAGAQPRIGTFLVTFFAICALGAVGLMSIRVGAVEAALIESCKSLLDPGGLGIQWTPHSHLKRTAKAPETLIDPYVQFALSNEDFRLFLVNEAKNGKGVLTDFKQLADAVPLYDKRKGPILPFAQQQNSKFKRQLAPVELSPSDLLGYITINYKLPKGPPLNKSFFTKDEKQKHHPLLKALVRQGLISSVSAQAKKSESLVAEALQKIHQTWEDLLRVSPESDRSTLLPVPNKYVVAGGRFREAYFWDTYWIMKGLIESGYNSTAKGMLENLIFLFERHNIIPNGNRFYYLTRTQIPILMEMVELLESEGIIDFTLLASSKNLHANPLAKTLESRILSVADRYYKTIWKDSGRFNERLGLFSYSDGAGGSLDHSKVVIRPESGLSEPRHRELHSQRVFAESGWDMSYTRFQDHPQSWLPVDLNFMLLGYTKKLAALFHKTGKTKTAKFYFQESESIGRKIDELLYDSKSGFYLDYHTVDNRLSRTITAASFFAFYFEAYPKDQGSIDTLRALLATLKPDGDLAIHTTNQPGLGQWDGSWSWAPLNEIAFQSLLRYGLVDEARSLAFDYCVMTLASFFQNNKAFYEKYQAKDGTINLPKDSEIYGNEEGFGWTNGTISVFLDALSKWGDLARLENAVNQRLQNSSIERLSQDVVEAN